MRPGKYFWRVITVLVQILIHFDSRFALWNVQLSGGLSLTWTRKSTIKPFQRKHAWQIQSTPKSRNSTILQLRWSKYVFHLISSVHLFTSIQAIKSKISLVWDGWSSRNLRPYTSVSIVYIHSPPENDNLWTLKSNLIEFNSTVGRHTGKMIGKDLVTTVRKFKFEKKVCFVLNFYFDKSNIDLIAWLDGWRWCKCQRCCRSPSMQGNWPWGTLSKAEGSTNPVSNLFFAHCQCS